MNEPTLETVRDYLLTKANDALRRPGMYGGETSIHLYLDAVAFAHGAAQTWTADVEDLHQRGGSNGLGVTGALAQILGRGTDDAVASVYADLAHRRNWLRLYRLLSATDYDEMRERIDLLCRTDITWSQIRERFGEPSVLFGGTNPRFPKTLGYASERPQDPLICLHLWNDHFHLWSDQEAPEEPVLLAVRRTDTAAAFRDGFTLTPAGHLHTATRPAPDTVDDQSSDNSGP
ncbi:hypothetical protein ACQPYK_49875 (plasmid) [Streptosporangium sp. CA-135522]|uniref:hypothetical protein n=1 Tax=Streptosporangium sp. CA-135522 TaxID=3240072 RepID=UPI003D94958E